MIDVLCFYQIFVMREMKMNQENKYNKNATNLTKVIHSFLNLYPPGWFLKQNNINSFGNYIVCLTLMPQSIQYINGRYLIDYIN